MTALLNIFAILTAFLGIYLGFQEAIKGIVVNIISRFIPEENINQKVLHRGLCRCDINVMAMGLNPVLYSFLLTTWRPVIRGGLLFNSLLPGL